MRSFAHTIFVLIAITSTLNFSAFVNPAVASEDPDLSFKLKTTLQYLLVRKRDLDRDLDELADQIYRLEHVRDFNAVARSIDDLQKKRRECEHRQDDVLSEIKDVESALRACK